MTNEPTHDEVLSLMRGAMGAAPPAAVKSTTADPSFLAEHMRSRAFAMPPDGALDDHTRTLIYLAAALAGSSPACVRAMAGKIAVQGIPAEKVREAMHIVRYAMATKVVGDAEPVFDVLNQQLHPTESGSGR